MKFISISNDAYGDKPKNPTNESIWYEINGFTMNRPRYDDDDSEPNFLSQFASDSEDLTDGSFGVQTIESLRGIYLSDSADRDLDRYESDEESLAEEQSELHCFTKLINGWIVKITL